jgi:hypothetical protein
MERTIQNPQDILQVIAFAYTIFATLSLVIGIFGKVAGGKVSWIRVIFMPVHITWLVCFTVFGTALRLIALISLILSSAIFAISQWTLNVRRKHDVLHTIAAPFTVFASQPVIEKENRDWQKLQEQVKAANKRANNLTKLHNKNINALKEDARIRGNEYRQLYEMLEFIANNYKNSNKSMRQQIEYQVQFARQLPKPDEFQKGIVSLIDKATKPVGQ